MQNKEKLIQLLLSLVEEKINTAKAEIESAREAQQNETKSSAGDKYETSREMMTQEIEKHSKSLADAEQQKSILIHLSSLKPAKCVELGSWVETNHGHYFLATGMGTLKLMPLPYKPFHCNRLLGKHCSTKSVEIVLNSMESNTASSM
jgi:hypothetical protein